MIASQFRMRFINKMKMISASLVFMGGFLVSCENYTGQIDSRRWMPGNAGREILEVDMPRLEQDALSGDAESAFRLANYYESASADKQNTLYWLTIAAENGSANAQYKLGLELAHEEDKTSRVRAIFWLRRAEESGVSPANSFLKELGEQPK